jgi:hypothetical protein
MTFTNDAQKAPKAVMISKFQSELQLLLRGQGVFLFATQATEKTSVRLLNTDKTAGLSVEFTQQDVKAYDVQSPEKIYTDAKCKRGLTQSAGAYYWISLDAQNQKLQVGIGEPRIETCIYSYSFEKLKSFLEDIVCLELKEDIVPMRLGRDPITKSVPLLIQATNTLTMEDIASGVVLPSASLSASAKQLHDCIAGKQFILDTSDFPEFSAAIEHSIRTPGLWCYERLKQKANEFSKDKPCPGETYLRITLGQNNGESPGVPYVMEIWPVGHYSPIHNHGGANAIIRVLHGSIHVSLFPYLSSDVSGVVPFATADFKKGDITWISPTLNQVHQLKNLPGNKDTCITIQCYMYDATDTVHYDYFDYINPDKVIEKYEPDSDMDFLEFKKLMKCEYQQGRRKSFWFC